MTSPDARSVPAEAPQPPAAGSLLARARAHARQRVADTLVLPIGGGVVGVRYGGVPLGEYAELRERFTPEQQTVTYLDLLVRCCREIVLRGDDGWVGLHTELGQERPVRIGDPEALQALDIDPAQLLDQHIPFVEPGKARHNALAVLTAYSSGQVVGLEVDALGQRLDAWLASGSPEVAPLEFPPA